MVKQNYFHSSNVLYTHKFWHQYAVIKIKLSHREKNSSLSTSCIMKIHLCYRIYYSILSIKLKIFLIFGNIIFFFMIPFKCVWEFDNTTILITNSALFSPFHLVLRGHIQLSHQTRQNDQKIFSYFSNNIDSYFWSIWIKVSRHGLAFSTGVKGKAFSNIV